MVHENTPLIEESPPALRRSFSYLNYRRPKVKGWWLAYYIPCVSWLSQYSLKELPGDVFAGVTLASFQIPVSLGYATTLAHVPAVSGLLGLIVQPVVYALMGTVPCMVVAPEAAISLVVGQIVAHYDPDDPNHRDGRSVLAPILVSSLLAGMVGIITLAAGILRVGFIEQVMSASMLRGFITGLGVVIITDQLPHQLKIGQQLRDGLSKEASTVDKFVYIVRHIHYTHVLTAVVAFSGLAMMLALKYVKRVQVKRGRKRWVLLPDILLVVTLSTILSYVFQFESRGVNIIGNVKGIHGIEYHWMLKPKYWKDFKLQFVTCFFLSFLGFMESTVAARNLPTPKHTTVSSNRELVAFGISNILGMCVCALPSFGGYGRSKINLLSGAKTQVAQLVAAAVTFLSVSYLMGLIYYLPSCILSSIVSTIGISLLEEAPKDIIYYIKVRGWIDLATIIASMLTTLFWSIEAGVAVGALVAVLRVLRHSTRPRIQILTRLSGTHEFVNADDMPGFPRGIHNINSGILIVKIPEPLTFANSGELGRRLRRLELHGTAKAHPGRPANAPSSQLHTVIFHLNGMTECDAEGARILYNIIQDYINRGITVICAEISPKKDVRELLENSGTMSLLHSQNIRQPIFAKLDHAMHAVEDNNS